MTIHEMQKMKKRDISWQYMKCRRWREIFHDQCMECRRWRREIFHDNTWNAEDEEEWYFVTNKWNAEDDEEKHFITNTWNTEHEEERYFMINTRNVEKAEKRHFMINSHNSQEEEAKCMLYCKWTQYPTPVKGKRGDCFCQENMCQLMQQKAYNGLFAQSLKAEKQANKVIVMPNSKICPNTLMMDEYNTSFYPVECHVLHSFVLRNRTTSENPQNKQKQWLNLWKLTTTLCKTCIPQ